MLTKHHKQHYPFITLFIFIILFLVACGSTDTNIFSFPKNTVGYIDISATQLEEALVNKDFTLVNVHIPYTGDIPQTDISIPFNEIEANLDQLPSAKDAKIVVYCRSGSMSAQASETLVKLGYTNIVDVNGGMVAWQSAGNELLTK